MDAQAAALDDAARRAPAIGPRRRLAVVAGMLAAIVAMGAGAVALAAGEAGVSTATSFEIVIRHSKFEPSRIAVPVGVPVTITLRNTDPIDHEWIVGDDATHAVHRTGTELLHPSGPTEVMIHAGETQTTVVTFETVGSLRFICHLPAHEAYGMVGTVVIR